MFGKIQSRREYKKITNKLLTSKQCESICEIQHFLESRGANRWLPWQIETIARFIEYDDGDMLRRFKVLNDWPNRKDSSSKEVFMLRYGKAWERFWSKKIKKCVHSFDNFKMRYGVNADEEWKKYCVKRGHSLDGYIVRYGPDEGQKRYAEFWRTTNFSTSLRAAIQRSGDEVIGQKIYDGIRQRISFVQTKEYLGEAGYLALNAKKAAGIRAASYDHDNLSLFAFQRRYGEIDGERRYCEFWESQSRGWQEASFESLVYFVPLYRKLRRLGYSRNDLWFGVNGSREYLLVDPNNRKIRWRYDFTILSKKIIVEFNGVAFHPNRDKLSVEQWNVWRHVRTKQTASEKYEKDMRKQNVAKDAGFSFYVLWSDNSNADNWKILNLVLEQCASC